MNINELECNLEKIDDDKYASIVALIIDSVRDYPITDLIDIDLFFDEIKNKIRKSEISSGDLIVYLESIKGGGDENYIWVETSLNSLFQAFQLMEKFHISFDDVLRKINSY